MPVRIPRFFCHLAKSHDICNLGWLDLHDGLAGSTSQARVDDCHGSTRPTKGSVGRTMAEHKTWQDIQTSGTDCGLYFQAWLNAVCKRVAFSQ